MKKKWILLLLISIVNINFSLIAQRTDRRHAEFVEFKEKRVAFISKAMDLTQDEAKVFWPMYNELQEKKFELNQQMRRALFEFMRSEREGKPHLENKYKEIVDLCVQFKIKESKLDEDYTTKFSKIISYKKIFRYQQAEQQFARQMLEQRSQRAPERRNGR